ncbi:diguanylate cyclase [Sphingomonas sp. LB-2]|uniref:sensor domain-containing diguanylate cyclase n=1 Tax=Sphingomonas caeni TaxID=2984949 RepID=UPI00222FB3EF|nr:sensor domain-containing diguanylate cyclase [Sphingomonas caeni]MCW3846327.1 diguanylate cyclase [Sphingomonas caeni]
MSRLRARLLAPLALMLCYFALAGAAIALTRLSGGVALLWVATAPLLAMLVGRKPRRWAPLIAAAAIGSLLASFCFSAIWQIAPILGVANMAEAVIGALLIRRWHGTAAPLASPQSIIVFIAAAGLLAPAVSGLPAAAAVSLWLDLPFGKVWFDWLIGHGLGSLIVTPIVLLALHREPERSIPRHRLVEGAGLALLVGIVTAAVFAQHTFPLLFVTALPVMIATMHLGRAGASLGIVIVALVGGAFTLMGSGPMMLIAQSAAVRLQFFQLFLGVEFLLALPVAAVLSQRSALMRALSESEARYRLFADTATDAMFTLDPDGTIRFASPAVRELAMYEPEALVGTNALTLVIADDRARVQEAHRQALAHPDRSFRVEYRSRRADGEEAWFETNTRAVADPDGVIVSVVSVVRDLSDRKQREHELERAATTDPLTGLLNRRAFQRAGADMMALARRGTPSTLAILDLDHFKRVNDEHGHAAGDAALLMLADLLRDSLRPYDAIGRLGGEEFAILLHGLDLAAARPVCERLCRALAARSFAVPGGERSVTMSIGLAELCSGVTLDVVFDGADQALYRAKRAGRNRVEETADFIS